MDGFDPMYERDGFTVDKPHGWLKNELFYQPYRNPEGNKEKPKSIKFRYVYLWYLQLKL